MKPLTFAWKASFAPTHETGRIDKLITQHSVNLKEKFTQKKKILSLSTPPQVDVKLGEGS